jgi:hypothetical protein
MLSRGKAVFSSFVLLGVLLGGCQYLKKSGDASADASAEAAAPAPTETAAVEAVDAGATATATATAVVTRIVPRGADAGTADAGAAAAADAGVGQECCCEATGFPLQSVGMSDCNKTRKGQCVKKERCEAVVVVVDAGAAPTPPVTPPATPPAIEPQTCCCDVPNGTKVVISQKECATTKKGQCVSLASCGLKFRRPGQK